MLNTIAQRILIASLVLGVACGCAKQPAENSGAAHERSNASATQTEPRSQSAVRAYVDPKTGELREPTADELAAEAAAEAQKKQAASASSDREQLQSREVVTPSGAIEIQIDKSQDQPLRACIDDKGNAKMDHDCARPKKR